MKSGERVDNATKRFLYYLRATRMAALRVKPGSAYEPKAISNLFGHGATDVLRKRPAS
jgi:hypothetical protein